MTTPPLPETTADPPGAGLRLRVIYPDGRETSYPLQTREYRIGSDLAADIRFESAGVAGTHAFLVVRHDGVFLVNLQDAGSVLVEGSPVEGRQPIAIGHRIRIGHLVLELDVIGDGTGGEPGASSDGTARLRRGRWQTLMRALGGYAALNRLLAAEISPPEAAAAKAAMTHSKRALAAVFLGTAAFVIGRAALVPPGLFWLHELADDLLIGLTLLAAVGLGWYFHVRFAGRLLLPFLAMTAFQMPPSTSWDRAFWDQAGALTALCGLLFLLGWLLDFGAGHEEGRGRTLRRNIALTGGGLLLAGGLLAGAVFEHYEAADKGVAALSPWFSILCAVALMIGPWLIDRQRVLRPPVLAGDVLTCHLVAERRWLRSISGRILAIAIGLIPTLLFLNGLDLAEKMRWPDDPDVIRSRDEEGREHVWFWDTRARFFRTTDLQTSEIYGWTAKDFPDPDREQQFTEEIIGLVLAVQQNPSDGQAYAALTKALAAYRLVDAAALGTILWDDTRRTWYVEHNQTRPQRAAPAGLDLYHAQRNIGLRSYSRAAMELKANSIDILNWLAACFGVVGLIILWRRAGDSPTARWTGFWLVGVLCGIVTINSDLFVPYLEYEIWHRALDSPLSNMLLALWGGSQLLQYMLIILNLASLSLCAAWVHLCWPPREAPARGLWTTRGIIVAKILLVTAACNALALLVGAVTVLALGDDFAAWGMAAASIAVNALALGLGAYLRTRTRLRSEVPQAGWLLAVTYLLSQIAAVYYLFLLEASDLTPPLMMTAKVLVCLFLLSALIFIVHTQFLRISAERDISFVVLTLLLPFLFEGLENFAQDLLKQTPFFSERGASILGLVMVVVLLGPLWRLLGQAITWLTVRRFAQVKRAVTTTMLAILEADDDTDFRERALAMFRELGIQDFVFYRRGRGDTFDMTIRGVAVCPAARIVISPMLRATLGHEASFIDTESIAFEWRYFFEQFELQRLRNITGCRHLLPISVGGSVRGVLGLPDNEESRQLSRSAMAPQLTEFGMSLFVRSG